MDNPSDHIGLRFTGHVLIRDRQTKEVLVDKFNAIHYENMSEALALSLTNRSGGFIYQMVFGNGATSVSSVSTITYFPPNVLGSTAQLYNQTYAKVVDDMLPLTVNPNPADNNLVVNHVLNTTYSDIVVTCTLEFAEPAEQSVFDDASSPSGTYIFNELGLKSYDPTTSTGAGKLLSHVVFHPVQKALNRTIDITYTIRLVLA